MNVLLCTCNGCGNSEDCHPQDVCPKVVHEAHERMLVMLSFSVKFFRCTWGLLSQIDSDFVRPEHCNDRTQTRFSR